MPNSRSRSNSTQTAAAATAEPKTETPTAEQTTETPAPKVNKGKANIAMGAFAASASEAFDAMVEQLGGANFDADYVRLSVKRTENGNKVSIRATAGENQELKQSVQL